MSGVAPDSSPEGADSRKARTGRVAPADDRWEASHSKAAVPRPHFRAALTRGGRDVRGCRGTRTGVRRHRSAMANLLRRLPSVLWS